jgi:hypothetical protein
VLVSAAAVHNDLHAVLIYGDTMKKKRLLDVEADLDPPGHTRPGSKAAEVALKDSKLAEKRPKLPGTSSRSRSGATAATRSGVAAKRKRAR